MSQAEAEKIKTFQTADFDGQKLSGANIFSGVFMLSKKCLIKNVQQNIHTVKFLEDPIQTNYKNMDVGKKYSMCKISLDWQKLSGEYCLCAPMVFLSLDCQVDGTHNKKTNIIKITKIIG